MNWISPGTEADRNPPLWFSYIRDRRFAIAGIFIVGVAQSVTDASSDTDGLNYNAANKIIQLFLSFN
ncbi:MAG: hypothetical protein ACOC1D_00085 [Prolixibacteraceae bacterium]